MSNQSTIDDGPTDKQVNFLKVALSYFFTSRTFDDEMILLDSLQRVKTAHSIAGDFTILLDHCSVGKEKFRVFYSANIENKQTAVDKRLSRFAHGFFEILLFRQVVDRII